MSTGAVPRAVVSLATRVLPPGDLRERYRREFTADLDALDRRRRPAYVVGVVANLGALRAAVRDEAPMTSPERTTPTHKPLLCRFHLHRWHYVSTDDGRRFRRCRRCGHDDDGTYDVANPSFTSLGG